MFDLEATRVYEVCRRPLTGSGGQLIDPIKNDEEAMSATIRERTGGTRPYSRREPWDDGTPARVVLMATAGTKTT